MKILNLYAGIGGNRKLWSDEHEITAIENNPEIAKIYKDFFPKDKVIVTDAHQYLLDHFQEYDFIWSSRPCQTHSKVNAVFNAHGKGLYAYPDMKLYEEIIFLKHFFKGKWVVENVIPYYKPLIKPSANRDRHLFWANFHIQSKGRVSSCEEPIEWTTVQAGRYGFDIKKYKLNVRKTQILRNCVNPKIGKHIFDSAFKTKQETLKKTQNSPKKIFLKTPNTEAYIAFLLFVGEVFV